LAGNPPEQVTVKENGLSIVVDIVNGHKTGFYLDQMRILMFSIADSG